MATRVIERDTVTAGARAVPIARVSPARLPQTGQDPPGDGYLNLLAGSIGAGRVAGATKRLPGRGGELQSAVVAVASVDGPVATALTGRDSVPDRARSLGGRAQAGAGDEGRRGGKGKSDDAVAQGTAFASSRMLGCGIQNEDPLLTCAGEVSCRVQVVRCLAGVPASPQEPTLAGSQVGSPTLVHAQESPGSGPPTRFGAANTRACDGDIQLSMGWSVLESPGRYMTPPHSLRAARYIPWFHDPPYAAGLSRTKRFTCAQRSTG